MQSRPSTQTGSGDAVLGAGAGVVAWFPPDDPEPVPVPEPEPVPVLPPDW